MEDSLAINDKITIYLKCVTRRELKGDSCGNGHGFIGNPNWASLQRAVDVVGNASRITITRRTSPRRKTLAYSSINACTANDMRKRAVVWAGHAGEDEGSPLCLSAIRERYRVVWIGNKLHAGVGVGGEKIRHSGDGEVRMGPNNIHTGCVHSGAAAECDALCRVACDVFQDMFMIDSDCDVGYRDGM